MTTRSTRALMAGLTAGLVISAVGTGVTTTDKAPPVGGHGAAGGHWAGGTWAGWLGASDADPVTTLRQVRTLIGADTGTAASLTGKGVGVALIDTGVAPVAGLPASRIVNGPDLSLESQSPALRHLDTYGHGTHMAGIIVGNDAGTGTTGLAPGARVTSVKVGGANGAVDVTQVIAAVDWVVQHRNDDPAYPIKVLNLSYGSGGQPQPWNDALGFAVETAWQSGIVVVAAAGNDGAGASTLANPASNEHILTAGAAATNGTAPVTDDTMAAFTNQPTGGGKQLNVLSPGVSLLSLRNPLSYLDETYPSARVGETLFRGSGTSQSAAVVSAAVALLRQARPSATPNQIKDWIVRSATYVPNGVAANYGLKELNVNAALARSSTITVTQTWTKSSGLGALDVARGASRLILDDVALDGEQSVWGPFDARAWTKRSRAAMAWYGGTWMGYRITGDGWTGTSWAARTWAPATWTARPWSGAANWIDPAWEGRSWTGRSWTGRSWTGRSWTSDTWTGRSWTSDNLSR